jgi:hypothetical protein
MCGVNLAVNPTPLKQEVLAHAPTKSTGAGQPQRLSAAWISCTSTLMKA